MIKFLRRIHWNTPKKKLPKVTRDLFGRLFPNEVIEENDAEYYQTQMKKTKAEELNDILSQTFWHWFNCPSNPKYFESYQEMIFLFEATQETQKLSRD